MRGPSRTSRGGGGDLGGRDDGEVRGGGGTEGHRRRLVQVHARDRYHRAARCWARGGAEGRHGWRGAGVGIDVCRTGGGDAGAGGDGHVHVAGGVGRDRGGDG